MLNLEKSAAAFAEAKTLMPGGVNSPVRSYRNVDCNPPFIARAEGSHIYDIDGNEYIDYVGSWGPMVVGHAHPQVVKALQEAAARGTSYGAPTLIESELAKLVMQVYPKIEVIRMVNSGTEATMSALRLARGYTHRDKIVKFIGCYHGHSDSLLVKAGSGLATFGVPDSPEFRPVWQRTRLPCRTTMQRRLRGSWMRWAMKSLPSSLSRLQAIWGSCCRSRAIWILCVR